MYYVQRKILNWKWRETETDIDLVDKYFYNNIPLSLKFTFKWKVILI